MYLHSLRWGCNQTRKAQIYTQKYNFIKGSMRKVHLYMHNIYLAIALFSFKEADSQYFWFEVYWEFEWERKREASQVHHLIPLITFQSLPEEEPAVGDFSWDLRPAAAPVVAAGDFSHFQRAWKPAENQPHQN